MPRNGVGVYSAPGSTWNPPVNGVTATAADWAALIADMATAFTQSLAVDGQAPATGNLPMGGNKLTGLANGSAATDSVAYGQVNLNVGQCLLSKSGSNLLLLPHKGNRLTINGVICTIPAAGLTLAIGAAAASTVYNIYAVATGTAVSSIEFSTTAHATDSATGVEIKSGDATRTLVGKARTTVGTAWADTDSQRFVINWFNRTSKRIYNTNGSAPATTSTTPVSLVNQMEYLAWGDACVPASFVGSSTNTTTNAINYTALGHDSSTVFAHSPAVYQAYTTSSNGAATGGSTFLPAEGYHFIYTLGQVSGGTGTWIAGIEMSGVIQG